MEPVIHNNPGEPPESFTKALRHVLLALVRLLMRFRVVYPQLTEMLKSAYVDIAEKEFRLGDKPQTDTRINLLTGIHRKDIKRLRSQLSSGIEEPLGVSQSVRIVSRWLSEPTYTDNKGKPLPLPLKSADGPAFESLVQEVCRQDLRPRVILDEWLRLGILSKDTEQNLVLNADAFVPSQGSDEKAFFLGMNISDHLNAASKNLFETPSPFFERCVYYDELSDDSIEELNELAHKLSMETLTRINDRAAKLKQRDRDSGGGNKRINVGLYVYHETTESGEKA